MRKFYTYKAETSCALLTSLQSLIGLIFRGLRYVLYHGI
jgi:hypothetical protein